MLSPSDFNDAVPQFTNGSYANDPLNPLFIEEPGVVDYNRGVEPLQTLPAQWWNWFANKFTTKLNKLNIYVKNIFDELSQLLSLVGLTPDATEEALTTGQLKGMFQTNYPQHLKDNFTSNVSVSGSKNFFTADGMFNYTMGSTTPNAWLSIVLGRLVGRYWKSCNGVPYYPLYSSITFGEIVSNENILLLTAQGQLNGQTNTGGIWWTENGIDWTKCETLSINSLVAKYANGIWVAGTNTNGAYWSEDGKTWIQGTGDGQPNVSIQYCIEYINGIWITDRLSHGFAWSVDGKEWTYCTGAVEGHRMYKACYFKGIYVGVGNVCCWSEDGKTWTQGTGYTTSGNNFSQSFVATDDILLYGSSSNGLWWSEDGKTWYQCSGISTTTTPGKVSFANGIFYLGSYYSLDGKTFQSVTGVANVRDTVYANGVWVCCANTSSTNIYWSVNGIDFNASAVFDSNQTVNVVKYINGTWFALTSKGLWLSENGINWFPAGSKVVTQNGKYISDIPFSDSSKITYFKNVVVTIANMGGAYSSLADLITGHTIQPYS